MTSKNETSSSSWSSWAGTMINGAASKASDVYKSITDHRHKKSNFKEVMRKVNKRVYVDPQKSLDTWKGLSEANARLEAQFKLLSNLAEEYWDIYRSIIYSCSMYQSEKVIHRSGPMKCRLLEFKLGIRERGSSDLRTFSSSSDSSRASTAGDGMEEEVTWRSKHRRRRDGRRRRRAGNPRDGGVDGKRVGSRSVATDSRTELFSGYRFTNGTVLRLRAAGSLIRRQAKAIRRQESVDCCLRDCDSAAQAIPESIIDQGLKIMIAGVSDVTHV
ncbi:hypothetical protein SSX86_010554 [Deinandra increscens subsp. villosa]|uniref:Uncharacterized protein n=1 Tax=Deinandra increscens subsp. villosa TaxID=3103831 RepID=A0AAP0H2H9_9ASTR